MQYLRSGVDADRAVVAFDAVDPHNVGAHVGKQHRTERRGADAAGGDHPEAG